MHSALRSLSRKFVTIDGRHSASHSIIIRQPPLTYISYTAPTMSSSTHFENGNDVIQLWKEVEANGSGRQHAQSTQPMTQNSEWAMAHRSLNEMVGELCDLKNDEMDSKLEVDGFAFVDSLTPESMNAHLPLSWSPSTALTTPIEGETDVDQCDDCDAMMSSVTEEAGDSDGFVDVRPTNKTVSENVRADVRMMDENLAETIRKLEASLAENDRLTKRLTTLAEVGDSSKHAIRVGVGKYTGLNMPSKQMGTQKRNLIIEQLAMEEQLAMSEEMADATTAELVGQFRTFMAQPSQSTTPAFRLKSAAKPNADVEATIAASPVPKLMTYSHARRAIVESSPVRQSARASIDAAQPMTLATLRQSAVESVYRLKELTMQTLVDTKTQREAYLADVHTMGERAMACVRVEHLVMFSLLYLITVSAFVGFVCGSYVK